MSFLETPRFPDEIAFYAQGGVSFNTNVIQTYSGREIRNQMWQYGKGVWDLSEALRTIDTSVNTYNLRVIRDFFRVVKGRLNGFRFKDFTDFQDDGNGILGITGLGTGDKVYQMYKVYITGSLTDQRIIQKPLATGITATINGSAASVLSWDSTTGLLTFNALASSACTSITVGTTTTVVLTTNPGTLSAGKYLYLGGFGGADSSFVNNQRHLINSVSGSGPYTFVLATNTFGKTISTSGGSGATGYKYPQATDTIAWQGQFDVPCRFDMDNMSVQMQDGGLYSWSGLSFSEIRL